MLNEGPDDHLEFYSDEVWNYIQPFSMHSGTMPEKQFRQKVAQYKLKLLAAIEKHKNPPPDCVIVRVYKTDGTPFMMPTPSTSKAPAADAAISSQGPSTSKKPNEQPLIDYKFFQDDKGRCFDIHPNPIKYIGSKQEHLRHLYRIVFWLDFITQGFDCNKKYLDYF